MKKTFTIPRLNRVVAVLDGSAKLENPYDIQNLRLQGYDYWMRNGYTPIQAKQTGYVDNTAYGLGWFQGVSQTSTDTSPTAKEEFITIEQAGSPTASIRPYSRNATTLVPTQIGTDTLVAGKWNFANYNDYVYAINPGATKTVYKHLIGELTGTNAWANVQDSSYSAPPSDPVLLVNSFPNYDNMQRGFLVTDTVTFNGPGIIQSGTETYNINANNEMEIGGNAHNGGIYWDSTFTIDFTANPSGVAEDWSTYGYIGISLKGNFMSDFKQFFNVQIKIGGVWVNVESKAYYGNQSTTLVYDRVFGVLRIKGVAGTNAVQGVRFTVTSGGTNYVSSSNWVKIEKIYLRGNFLEAKASSSRIWFPNGSTTPATTGGYNTGIKYGVRFTHSTGTPTPSNADIETITAQQAQGTYILPAYFATQFSIGGVVSLSVSPTNTATYNKIQFLRQMEDGVTWKLLSEQNNTGTSLVTVFDTKEEHELSSLTTVTVTANTTPPITPTFRTAGIVGAFAYKQSMVWLVNQTYQNLQFSRVGDPLELYDTTRAYDDQDVTIPAQFTLADDQADTPIWGTQAGQTAFIIGQYAAYAMTGDYPRNMTPSRKIPGSRGIVGYYAGTRFRSQDGAWSCAYADTDLNIWNVSSVPLYPEDTSAKPQEISLPIRGKIKDYLYTQQKLTITNLDITDTKLEFEEETSTLWVMLGKRVAVFRQDMTGNGWELYDYTLASTGTISTCTTYFTDSATATEANPGDDSGWTNVGLPFSSDDAYCVSGTIPKGNNKETHYLRCFGYMPVPMLPAGATITSIKFNVEDSKVGDLGVTNVHAQPIQASTGTHLGTNQATGRSLLTTDVVENFTSSALQTTANLNSGLIGIDIKYRQEDWDTNWDNPSNYNIVVTGSTSANMTVTVTYTAGGAKPPYAFVNITSTATASLGVTGSPASPLPWTGYASNVYNGLEAYNSGTLSAPLDDPATTITATGTTRTKVTLTAGVGSTGVNRIASGYADQTGIGVVGTYSGSAAFSVAVASYVKVDNVALQICYSITSTGTNVKWDRAVFTPTGKYIAMRSTGEIDILEKDFRNGEFIDGTNRDGGLTPPNWFFTTQQIQWDGAKARLASVQYNGNLVTDVVNVAVSADGSAYVSGTLEGVNTSRWYKFHPSVSSGIRHNIRITGEESDTRLNGLALEFSIQSRGKPR